MSPITAPTGSTMTLVEKIRMMARDRPRRSRIVTAGIASTLNDTVVTLPAGHVAAFQEGQALEFDDDTDERAEVRSVDEANNQITIARAQESSAPAVHAVGTAILIQPRYSYVEVSDAASDIVEGELFPFVWVNAETTVAYQVDGHYAPAVTDIEEVIYAYQEVLGEIHTLESEWVGPEQSGASFPNGVLKVPDAYDTSTIYVFYRARPVLSSLPDRLLRLVALGAAAQLLMVEEAAAVGPDPSIQRGRVAEGARLRASDRMWQRFERRRDTERVNLQEDEDRKRPKVA